MNPATSNVLSNVSELRYLFLASADPLKPDQQITLFLENLGLHDDQSPAFLPRLVSIRNLIIPEVSNAEIWLFVLRKRNDGENYQGKVVKSPVSSFLDVYIRFNR